MVALECNQTLTSALSLETSIGSYESLMSILLIKAPPPELYLPVLKMQNTKINLI